MATLIYYIVCPSCNGAGVIPDPLAMSTTATVPCPACGGRKIIQITEITDGEFYHPVHYYGKIEYNKGEITTATEDVP